MSNIDHSTKKEIARNIIRNVYQKSRELNGDGSINYAYSAGSFEVVVANLIENHLTDDGLDKLSKRFK